MIAFMRCFASPARRHHAEEGYIRIRMRASPVFSVGVRDTLGARSESDRSTCDRRGRRQSDAYMDVEQTLARSGRALLLFVTDL